jgi:hypothetical protein
VINTAKILMLAQPDVPGLPILSEAEKELSVVRDIVGIGAVLEANAQRVEDVADALLARLGEASILHLACHAKQDRDDPLKSGFMLKGGRLTLGSLVQVRATKAELAYLSACESATMDENQPDEVINLAAAMLFVGFKSVIATLWYADYDSHSISSTYLAIRSMSDIDGPFMAERVYSSILTENKQLDLTAVPYALDDAVRQLRECGVHASRWATYVHIGI